MKSRIMKFLPMICILAVLITALAACDTTQEDQSASQSEAASETASQTEVQCLHEIFEYTVVKAATCTEKGTSNKICTECEAVLEVVEINPISHTSEIIPGKAPTCSSDGLTDGVKCSSCQTVLVAQEQISKLGHTERIIDGVSATCSAEGMSAGKECSSCGVVLVAQETIAKLEHTERIIAGTPATCTVEGKTEGKDCSICGTVITEQKTIDKLAHTEQIIEAIPATCTTDGKTAGKECAVCGTVIIAATTVHALDHNESDWIIDSVAGIGIEGSKHTECTRCSTKMKEETIPAITDAHIHVGSSWIVVTPSTCIVEGTKAFICDCGERLETESLPLADHTEEEVLGISPTCSATGLTDGTRCSVCGDPIVAQQTIDKLPHTPETVLGTAATCLSTGLTDGSKCSVCGEPIVEQETIAKLPHTEETIPGTSPTCTSTGLTDGKKCSVCGTETVAQEPIAKADHTEEIIPGIAATCTEYGSTDGKKCSVCKEILLSQVQIPPLGHSFSNGSCTSCGINRTYGVWIIDGLGNPVNNVVVKVLKNGEQVGMYAYNGSYLTFDLDIDTYQLELNLTQTGKSYTYDESLAILTPDERHAVIRLYDTPGEHDSLYVGGTIDKDYSSKSITQGSYLVELTPNDYTFFVFKPTKAAIYTITYECESEVAISYHGATFFVHSFDISDDNKEVERYENGLSVRVYATNIGNDYVFAVKSDGPVSCILNIQNAGDPGTRLEDEPWTPYLESTDMVNKQLSASKEGTYTAIDLTDTSVTAVYSEADGYYHLGSEAGPIIFIDLTSDSRYIGSIQTICANQRMGVQIIDNDGKLVEKRSFNELFHQYGMPTTADPVDEPIRVPLTQKLADAIREFGNKSGWWGSDPNMNIFTRTLSGATYNQEYAWLLYCGIYES